MDSSESGAARNRAHLPKRICGRFSKRCCIFFWVFLFLVLLLLFLLIFFLHVLPSGIRGRYERGLNFQNMHISKWVLFPDEKHDCEVVVKGESIHPEPFLGIDMRLRTWTFLNAKGMPLFGSHAVQESALPNATRRYAFESEMKIVSNSSNVPLNRRIREAFYPQASSSKEALNKVLFAARDAKEAFETVLFEAPAPNLQESFGRAIALQVDTKDSITGKMQFGEVQLRLTAEGVRLESTFNTKNFGTEIFLPKGTYPVYTGSIPVMILNTKDGVHIPKDSLNTPLNADLQFVKAYPQAGNLILSVLMLGIQTGHLDFQLGPPLHSSTQLTTESVKKNFEPVLDLPTFEKHWIEIQEQFKRAEWLPNVLVADDNSVHIELNIRTLRVLHLGSLAVDFGAKFKVRFEGEDVIEIGIPAFGVRTEGEYQVLSLELYLSFPEMDAEVQALSKLYHALKCPSSDDMIELVEIQFFSTLASDSDPDCAWCEALFSEIPNKVPLLPFAFNLDTYLSVKGPNDGTLPKFVKLENLFLSQRNELPTLGVHGMLDMSRLRMALKKGELRSMNGTITEIGAQECNEAQSPTHPKNDLVPFYVYQTLFLESLQLKGLAIVESECSLPAFTSLDMSLTETNLAWWITENIPLEVLLRFLRFQEPLPTRVAPASFRLEVLGDHAFRLSMSMDLDAPLPLSISLDAATLTLDLNGFEVVELSLPAIRFLKGGTTLYLPNLHIVTRGKEAFPAKVLSLLHAGPKEALPEQLTISEWRMGNGVGASSAVDPCNADGVEPGFTQATYSLCPSDLPLLEFRLDTIELPDRIAAFEIHTVSFKSYPVECKSCVTSTLEIEYSWNAEGPRELPFSLDIGYISFDFLPFGKRLGLFNIQGLHLEQGERKKVRLDAKVEFHPESAETVEACRLANGKMAAVCVQRLTFARTQPDARKETHAPRTLLFSERQLIQVSNLFVKMMEKTQFSGLHDLLNSTSVLQLASRLVLMAMEVDTDTLFLSEYALEITDEKLSFATRMQLPHLLFDIQPVHATCAVGLREAPLATFSITVANVTRGTVSSTFDVMLVVPFTVSQAGDALDSTPLNGAQHSAEGRRSGEPSSMLDSPLMLTVQHVEGEGVLPKLLAPFLGTEMSLGVSWNELVSLRFLGNQKQVHSIQERLQIHLGMLIADPVISITNGLVPFEVGSKRAIAVQAQFKLPPHRVFGSATRLSLPRMSVNAIVNDMVVGIFSLTNAIECHPCTNTELTLQMAYYAHEDEEAKRQFSSFLNPILQNTPSNIALRISNVRFHAKSPGPTSLLNALSISITSESVLKWIKEAQLSETLPSQTIEGKTDTSSVDKPYTEVDANIAADPRTQDPYHFSPEIRLRDISFHAEEEGNFNLSIAIRALDYKDKRMRIDGIKFFVSEMDGLSAQRLTDMNLKLVNIMIGTSSSLPSFNGPEVIKGYNELTFETGGMISKEDHQGYMKTVPNMQFGPFKLTTKNASTPLSMLTSLTYATTTTHFFPNFECEYSVGPQAYFHVKGQNKPLGTSLSSYDAVELDIRLMSNKAVYFETAYNDNELVLHRFSLNSLQLSDQRNVGDIFLEAKDVALLLSEEFYNVFFGGYAFYWKPTFFGLSAFQNAPIDPCSNPECFMSIHPRGSQTQLGARLFLQKYIDLTMDIEFLQFHITYVGSDTSERRSWSRRVEIRNLEMLPFQARVLAFEGTIASQTESMTLVPNEKGLLIREGESVSGWIIHDIKIGSKESEAIAITKQTDLSEEDLDAWKQFFTEMLIPNGRELSDILNLPMLQISSGTLSPLTISRETDAKMSFTPFDLGTKQDPTLPQHNFSLHFSKLDSIYHDKILPALNVTPQNFDLSSSRGLEFNWKTNLNNKTELQSFMDNFFAFEEVPQGETPLNRESSFNVNLQEFFFGGINKTLGMELKLSIKKRNITTLLHDLLLGNMVSKWESLHFDANDKNYFQLHVVGELEDTLPSRLDLRSIVLSSELYFETKKMGDFGMKDLRVAERRVEGTFFLRPHCDLSKVLPVVLFQNQYGDNFQERFFRLVGLRLEDPTQPLNPPHLLVSHTLGRIRASEWYAGFPRVFNVHKTGEKKLSSVMFELLPPVLSMTVPYVRVKCRIGSNQFFSVTASHENSKKSFKLKIPREKRENYSIKDPIVIVEIWIGSSEENAFHLQALDLSLDSYTK